MDRCAHGYRERNECPRCAPSAVTTVMPARRLRVTTRWRATATTLGPRTKIAITCALLCPVLVCLLGLAAAGRYVQNSFLVVPLWMFSVIAAVGIHGVWERG